MKPKFLQNSKDMLSRSFNPAKCKTSLKLAAPRLKLLRNKKEVQLTQMKRDIARLLESGEDQTAQIRVQHVIREEKLMAAYDLLEIYCELVVVRLPVIESQKNCPSDLKEAVTSLVFASLRCGDVPELLDVRKHFSAKYGKDFTKAAIELRPDCGVSNLLVQKLSAAAPDVQAKIKVLSAIAKEHNISWAPILAPEKEPAPPTDLPNGNGSSNAGKENEHLVEPPRIEAANFQAHTSDSGPISGVNTGLQDVTKPPEQSLQGDIESSPLDKERWNMEFKDAASAAQAAAESAEQASIAAKAAAELSKLSEMETQNSQESQKLEIYSEKVEATVIHESSGSPINTGFSEQTMEGDRFDQLEPESNGPKKDPFDKDVSTPLEEYLHGQSPSESEKTNHHSEPEDYINTSEQLSTYEADTANDLPTKSESFGDEIIEKEKQDSVSLAPPSSISDDYNIFADLKDQSFNHNAGDNAFLGNNVVSETHGETSHDFSDAVYDKIESDTDDDHGLFVDNIYGADIHHTPSLGLNSQHHLYTETDSLSPRLNLSESVEPTPSPFFTTGTSTDIFTENSSVGNATEVESHAVVSFDVSDGESSETEEGNNKPEDSRNLQSQHESHEPVESPNAEEGYSRFDRNRKPFSSYDELEPGEEIYGEGNKGFFDSDDEMLSTVKDDDSEDESIPQSGNSLSFGKLTGGLRHKGYNRLSFLKNGLDMQSPVMEASKEKPDIFTRPEEATNVSTDAHIVESPKKSKTLDYVQTKLDSDSSSDEEESLRMSSGYRRDYYDQISAAENVKTKPGSEASKPIFCSDDSDLDEHTPPKQPHTGKNRLRGGISRRTKAYPSRPGTNSFSKTRPKPESIDSDEGATDKFENYEQPTTAQVAPSPIESKFRPPEKLQGPKMHNSSKFGHEVEPAKEMPEPNSPNSAEHEDKPGVFKATSTSTEDSETSMNDSSSAVQEFSGKHQKTEGFISSEEETEDNASSDTFDSPRKASHVHPKLPDYDMLLKNFGKGRS